MTENEIRVLLSENQLEKFIIGPSGFFAPPLRPEEYAQRCRKVAIFYNDEATHQEKENVEKIILSFFDSGKSKYQKPAIIIGRQMNLPSLKKRIVNVFRKNMFTSFDLGVQNLTMDVAVSLEINEIIETIIKHLINKKALADFMFWSDTPFDKTNVSNNDMWRLKALANYYEENAAERNEIEKQLLSLPKGRQKIITIIEYFVSEISNHDNFKQVLQKYLD